MAMPTVYHQTQGRVIPRRVLFVGTANTTLLKGTGLCYNRTYGTAASVDGERDKRVALPTTSNNTAFAGVALDNYSIDSTGLQWIEIAEPGSVCLASIDIATTIGGFGTFRCSGADSGKLTYAGELGRGSAKILQTVAALTDTTTTPGVISTSIDGSATYTTATKTVTKTGAFTYAVAGDLVRIFAGSTTSGGAAIMTPDVYTIASVTSANAVVLSTAAGSADSSCAFSLIRGNPLAQVQLLDGKESGLVEWIAPKSAGTSTPMTSGYTLILGGFTITTDDAPTLADGVYTGQLKRFKLTGALTTNDYIVTVTTGKQLDGTTTLASLEFDGANDETALEWFGPHWRVVANAGTAQA